MTRNLLLWVLLLSVGLSFTGCRVFWNPVKPPIVNTDTQDPNLSDLGEIKPGTIGLSMIYASLGKLSFISPIAVGAMILGGIAFAYGHTAGLKILGAGFIALTIYLGVMRYLQWIMWVAFAGGACLVLYLILIRFRAWRDTVGSVDTLLDKMCPEDRAEAIKVLKGNQSDFTRNIVKKIKAEADRVKAKAEKKVNKHIIVH